MADDYLEAVRTGSGKDETVTYLVGKIAHARRVLTINTFLALLERHAVQQSPSRIEELAKIFVHATKVRSHLYPEKRTLMLTRHVQMEIGFWEMFPNK